jgi:hypothetical protein
MKNIVLLDKRVKSDLRELTTVSDDHGLGGPAGARSDLLDRLHDVQTLHDLSEDYVLAVKPLGLGGTDEELRPVCAGAGIGHGEDAGAGVLPDEVLIGELGAIDGLATCAVPGGEVSSLAHEPGDHPVEGRFLVVEWLAGAAGSLLTGAEGTEVLGRAGSGVGIELHHDPASRLVADLHVEENLRV